MKRLAWLIPLLAGAAAYAIAPWGDLVWDDDIVARQQLGALRGLTDVFAPPPGIPQWSYAYYRPVTVLSYLLDARLFGVGAAAGPHAMNVLYHLLATAFTGLLAARLLRHLPHGTFGALAAATLFAVHPIHVESVSWVTGRSDLLATLLFVPALLLGLRWRDRGATGALLAAPLLFLLALLAKEVAIAGLVILPLAWVAAAPDPAAPRRPRGAALTSFTALALGWLAAAGLYFVLRAGSAPTPTLGQLPAAELAATAARATAWYLAKLAWPWPQAHFVGADALPGSAAALATLALALALLAWAAWRWRAARDGTLFLGLWCTGAAIAPSLAAALPGLAETAVAERYLYLPSVGAALALGAVLGGAWAARREPVVTSAVALGAAALLAATLQRGSIWLNDLALWSDATAKAPGWGMPWAELGRARYAAGDVDGALEAYLRARNLRSSPKIAAVANFNVGLINAQRGNMAEAERAFAAAVAADPSYARGHYGVGRALHERALAALARGEPPETALALLREATVALERAVALAPTFTEAHVALAWILTARGDAYDRAGDPGEARVSRAAALARLDAAVAVDTAAATLPDVLELRRKLAVAARAGAR